MFHNDDAIDRFRELANTCCLQETYFKFEKKKKKRLKVEGWWKICQPDGNKIWARVAILIPDKNRH